MRADSTHVSEIESVLAGSDSPRDNFVVESWRRCVDEYQLDPARANEAYILPNSQLREHRERSERLIRIARASMEDLFAQIVGQNYVLLLTNELGVTVDFFGEHNFVRELKDAGLYLGSEWSEERAGTCGVGSCIVTGEAVTVHQFDHFDSTHTPLSCSAAPIFDTQGQLSAVLDISLLQSPSAKISQGLALHLAKTSAMRVELAGLLGDMRSEWVLCLSRSSSTLDASPEAAVALDGRGCVIGMTHSAARLLAALSGLSWRRPGELLGRTLQSFFCVSVEDLPRLTRAHAAHDRQLIGHDNSRWYGHAIDPAAAKSKPVSVTKHQQVVSRAQRLPSALAKLSGGDRVLDKTLTRVAKVARTPLPVLIQGETGVGKEYLARAIHDVVNADAPFVAINCAAIPESLIEGELFGHEAGAFTGASRRGRPGLIEAANGGTLFLDEIGDMPLALQARLLRFLSEGEVMRVGSTQVRKVQVRVLSASFHHLPELVQQNLFRSDLYYRLNSVEVYIPPLRHRSDMKYLSAVFLAKQGGHNSLSESALSAMRVYSWPGNLRELDNAMQLAAALCENEVIELSDLPQALIALQPIRLAKGQDAGVDATPFSDGQAGAQLLKAIAQCEGNKSRAAKLLGIDRSTLYRRLSRLHT